MKISLIVRLNRRRGTLCGRARMPLQKLFAACVLAGGLIGCGSVSEIPPVAATEPAPVPQLSPRVPKKSPPVRLLRLEAAVKKAIGARLNSWKASIEARDLDKHTEHYADQVDTYYLAANVSRDFIRAERESAFEQFDTFKVQFFNVDVNLQTADEAVITFDKTWDFQRAASFSNGLVRQEVIMRKIEKQWFIVSEKDLEIYRYQNN